MVTYILYTKVDCSLCDEAKRFLREQQVGFKEHLLLTPTDIKQAKSRLPDPEARVMLPLVFVEDKYIGGKDDMIRHITASYR